MLLDYFVTSRTRRELLRLLWAEGVTGSGSDLSRRAGVRYSAVHRELEAARGVGLVVCERSGNRVVYRANLGHEQASLVAALLMLDRPTATASSHRDHDDRVRTWLAQAGAPLFAQPSAQPGPAVEVVLAEALAVSHRDATVARVLPLALWRQRGRLDHGRLVEEATRRDERQTLGFFLELTGRLAGDSGLVAAARDLRDRRRKRPRLFFGKPHGPMALAAARRKTPRLARKWGYLMNMGLDAFASAFEKHSALA